MKIVFDPAKRESNLQKHGVDMADLDLEFFMRSMVTDARDGRYRAIGIFNGSPLAVIFKPLGSEAISVISARTASKKERRVLG